MKNCKYLFLVFILTAIGLTASAQNKKTDREMFKEGYTLKTNDIHFAPPSERYEPIMPRLYSIEKRRKETVVTFVQPIYFDSQWVTYDTAINSLTGKAGTFTWFASMMGTSPWIGY